MSKIFAGINFNGYVLTRGGGGGGWMYMVGDLKKILLFRQFLR